VNWAAILNLLAGGSGVVAAGFWFASAYKPREPDTGLRWKYFAVGQPPNVPNRAPKSLGCFIHRRGRAFDRYSAVATAKVTRGDDLIMVRTTKKLSAMRQILMAIRCIDSVDYECAVTLAGAAEGQIDDKLIPTDTEPHLFRVIRKYFSSDETNADVCG